MMRKAYPTVAAALFVVLSAAVLAAAAPADREVTFVTSDNVRLTGTVSGSGIAGVVLAHMLGGDRSDWTPFARLLAREGYTVLAFDFRGHGKSPGSFDEAVLDRDVRAAAGFLKDQGVTRVALIGASMGGTASIKVAASDRIAALVVISSPMMYGARLTQADLARLTMSSLWIASEKDQPYATTVRNMYAVAKGEKSLHVYPGARHGTQLFSSPYSADFTSRLLGFLKRSVPPR